MILFALGISNYGDILAPEALHGLKVVAVAVVAQAVWGMARNLCPDAQRISLMAVAACITLLVSTAVGHSAVIIASAVVGLLLDKPVQAAIHDPLPVTINRRAGVVWLSLFLVLLLGLPVLAKLLPNQTLAEINAFYRAGTLPFWEWLRRNVHMRAALSGINAAVVALVFWKLPPWLVVLGSGLTGWLLSVTL